MKATAGTVQKIVLLFWSCYFSIVTLTNILDGLKAMGALPKDWKFASGNFEMILQTTANLSVPVGMNAFLFCGVILLELITSILFWKSLRNTSDTNIYSAHSAGLILFAGFIMADEIFFAYAVEATHMRIFFGLLVSLATLIILRRTKEN
ncbi:MAG: hypothetical protein J0M18_05990 [Ignavibacteria bacterium]|jgi:hypothetical protein|nr:hypothetical protein [Ignavibacteria bacterium]